MLIRAHSDRSLLVSQPMHSWVSGQLARCWGNDLFGGFNPREEVCLAAELHDIGFSEWERAPSYNPATSRPHDFMDLPLEPHLALWVHTVEQMRPFGRYPTLLVSFHVTALCENHMKAGSPREAEQIGKFLKQQTALQETLLGSLRADPIFAPHATPSVLERNRRLIAVWDQISLLCVLAERGVCAVDSVPTSAGSTRLILDVEPEPFSLRVDPWPFAVPEVRIECEGRWVARAFSDESEMRRQLAEAGPRAFSLCLKPKPTHQEES